MAGIAGILDTAMLTGEETLLATARAMAERAPGSGSGRTDGVAEASAGIALAVSGVTDRDDPARMTALARSRSGRYLLAMTGANSTFPAIRSALSRDLLDQSLPSAALIAEAVDTIGITETLRLAAGPLALAVWDRRERTLTLGRDRHGQEPMYAAWAGSLVLFGSHLGSIMAHPGFQRTLDQGALALFVRHKQIPSPWSVFEQTVKLVPGATLTMRTDRPNRSLTQQPYVSDRDAAQSGFDHPYTGTADEAVAAVERGLHQALDEATTEAASPLGIFFSGGIDSTVLAVIAAGRQRPVHAFTVGFDEPGFDEAGHAAAIARHLGLDHHILRFTPNDMRDLLPVMPSIYQEPFADLATLPTTRMAQAAGGTVPLVLTGDGGDDLFGGGPDYLSAGNVWRERNVAPAPVRRLLADSLDLLAAPAWYAAPIADRYGPDGLATQVRPTRLRKLAAGLRTETPEQAMYIAFSETVAPERLLRRPHPEPLTHYTDPRQWLARGDTDIRWRYLDFRGFALDIELQKHQRAAAAAGLMVRAPLMHPAVADLAWSFPLSIRRHNGIPRWLLRELIVQAVPESLFERKKAGFGVPLHQWWRGPLRDVGEDVFNERNLRDTGLFNPVTVRREWEQHLSGKHDRRYLLFALMSLHIWFESLRRTPVIAG